jgi:membrane protease YdiL (CAAX protease family)
VYQKQPKVCGVLAVGYYVLSIAAFFAMGMLYERGIENYILLYWSLPVLAAVVVLVLDGNVRNLGLGGANIKKDLLLSGALVVVILFAVLLLSHKPMEKLIRGAFYYLIRIAFVEELIFRGFLQNYLFGIRLKKQHLFLLGAACFSLMHVPFQMYVNHMVSLEYFLFAWPQLLFTFGFHLIMCWITKKRENILIPAVLHFALDYLQAAL